MKLSFKHTALVLALALPLSAQAHKVWLRPSQTVLSGNSPWITVDAAISNDLFFFNHRPVALQSLQITAPDGSTVQPQNAATGQLRSVFDVALEQTGTYRIASVNSGLFANWKENGQPKRWRGRAEDFASQVPQNAEDLQVNQTHNRVETFVSNGNPNDTALKISGSGLELQPITHPNDLVEGEEARFRLLIDGQPANGIELEIVRGETRYRNAQEEIKLKTDASGEFAVRWPHAGMYWLEATAEDDKTSVAAAKQRRLLYVATFEVLPQ